MLQIKLFTNDIKWAIPSLILVCNEDTSLVLVCNEDALGMRL